VDFPDADWDEIMNVNVTAGFKLSGQLAKHWLNRSLRETSRRKRIIFVASMTGFAGKVEIPAYTASKGAIAQLTKVLNNEWMSKGINVDAITSGSIETA